MDITDAFQIVIDLAKQSAFDLNRLRVILDVDRLGVADSESIYTAALKQNEAIRMVEDFAVNQLGDD